VPPRLLIVDENDELGRLVAAAAARLDAEAVVSATWREALESLAAPLPGAAVVDLPLGDARGREILAALRAAGVPVVVLSGVYKGPRYAD
jgi:DNA-binding response OmpR family regulator